METRGFCRRVYVLARIFGKIESVAALVMLLVERGCIVLVLCAVSRADKWTHSEIKVGVRVAERREAGTKIGEKSGMPLVACIFRIFIISSLYCWNFMGPVS